MNDDLTDISQLLDLSPDPVLTATPSGEVVYANAAARRVFGSKVAGANWLHLCPSVDPDSWREALTATDPVTVEVSIGDSIYAFSLRHDTTQRVVVVFGSDVTRRARAEQALRRSERMATLGTLTAGVAHELNNPAAATRRAAEQLRSAFAQLEQAHLALERFELNDAVIERLRAIDRQARERAGTLTDLSALEQSDREAALEDWLEGHVDDGAALATALVALGLDTADLDELARLLDGEALSAVLTWTASVMPVHSLLYEIGQGAARISEIVTALKAYSFLGQAPLQPVDLHEGLDNTLVILRGKLKAGIEIRREYDPALPPVPAHGSELNQLWTNLVDNAVDAMQGRGLLTIRTRREASWAVVEIEDNGSGIPDALQGRVFDPFFTTKEPGKGTGLGLSTSYSIVTERHGGRLDVTSHPGFTRFTVRLPLTPLAERDAAQRPTQ